MRQIKFKNFVILQRGFDLPKNDMLEGTIPVIGSTSIIGYHNEYKVKPPGVVTGRSGSLGQVQFVAEKYWPHNTSLWVKDFQGNHPKYVYYFLKTLDLSRFNAGAGVPTLNRNHLDELNISIHEPKEQRRIADILSAYDDLIENNARRIRILGNMAQTIYREWFGKVNPKSLPDGWNMKTIGDYGDVITGKTPSKTVEDYWNSRDVPFIRTPDMHDQFYCIETTDYVSIEGANSQPNTYIPANSLCVSCIGTVGIVTITSVKAQTNQQINSVVLNDLSDLEFLYFELLGLKETIQSYGATGATMANLSKGKFMALNVLHPPKQLREEFHVIVWPIFEQIKTLQYKNANLRQTRDLLLPRLVSGEIDISGLSN